jgi:hypothetical protein
MGVRHYDGLHLVIAKIDSDSTARRRQEGSSKSIA